MTKVTIPIGPQHPLLKEPLSFLVTVEGERVVDSKMRLGYVHRGIERLCQQRTYVQNVHLMERVCGICSHVHTTTYCQGVEALLGLEVPERGLYLRTLLCELERIHLKAISHLGNRLKRQVRIAPLGSNISCRFEHGKAICRICSPRYVLQQLLRQGDLLYGGFGVFPFLPVDFTNKLQGFRLCSLVWNWQSRRERGVLGYCGGSRTEGQKETNESVSHKGTPGRA